MKIKVIVFAFLRRADRTAGDVARRMGQIEKEKEAGVCAVTHADAARASIG